MSCGCNITKNERHSSKFLPIELKFQMKIGFVGNKLVIRNV